MRLTVKVVLLVTLALQGCALSHHPAVPSSLGIPKRFSELEALIDAPGVLTVETVNSCDWEVDRSGLINLSHATAKEARLAEGPEPIQVYFHVIRHPKRGTFIVDTGVEKALRDAPEQAAIQGLVAKVFRTERMVVRTALGDWLAQEKTPLAGVLLTHLHTDHISGLPDVPRGTPLYAGPGETSSTMFLHAFLRGTIDRLLAGHGPIHEWKFAPEDDSRFAGIIDVFGDGSLWALHVPGHTPGSTAYVARTAEGPVLLTGDTSHTAWGWTHDVEPGSYTLDHALNAESLARLRRLADEHPKMKVRLGHQTL